VLTGLFVLAGAIGDDDNEQEAAGNGDAQDEAKVAVVALFAVARSVACETAGALAVTGAQRTKDV